MSIYSSSDEQMEAIQIAQDLLADVKPGLEITHYEENEADITRVFHKLDHLTNNRIVIAVGHDRHSLDDVKQILANNIADGKGFMQGRSGVLRRCESVKELLASTLKSYPPGRITPDKILHAAFQLAEEGKFLLVISYFEVFADPKHHVSAIMRNSLMQSHDAVVIGLYEESQGDTLLVPFIKDLPCEEAHIKMLSKTRTRRILREVYFPQWNSQYQIEIDGNAYEDIFRLALGSWIGLATRATLPKLAIEITEDTLRLRKNSIISGDSIIRDAAQEGCDEIDRLFQNEWANLADRRFDSDQKTILDRVKKTLEEFRDMPEKRKSLINASKIIGDHLMLAFFSPGVSDCSFHFSNGSPNGPVR